VSPRALCYKTALCAVCVCFGSWSLIKFWLLVDNSMYEGTHSLMGSNTVYLGESSTIQKDMSLLSSGSKSEPSKKLQKWAAMLKMWVTCSSEMLGSVRTSWLYTPEDIAIVITAVRASHPTLCVISGSEVLILSLHRTTV
jgi:hypothetical protein